jgi:hypothetical protein
MVGTISSNPLILKTADAERVRVLANGNVGIGTSTPVEPVAVEKNIAGDAFVNITNNSTDVAARAGVTLTNEGTSYGANSGGLLLGGISHATAPDVVNLFANTGIANGVRISATGAAAPISFHTAGTAIERMRITPAGNVGIGVVAPSELLEVNGNVKAAAYLYTSDARLKKDVITLPEALSKALQLRGVNFVWKSNDEKTVGFIAQEVEMVYPELVRTDPVSGYKSVQYGNIVAVLVEALKEEHQQRVEAQRNIASTQQESEARLQKLEKENQDLKSRLDRLEKLLSNK